MSEVPLSHPDLVVAALDSETTGLDPARHAVLALGLTCRIAGHPDAGFVSLVNGSWDYATAEALALNGLNPTDTQQAPPLATVYRNAQAFLARQLGTRRGLLLIHNAAFDLQFLPTTPRWPLPILDTSALARALLAVDESLSSLLARFGIPRAGAAHTVASDTQAVLDLWDQVLRPRLPTDATIATALQRADAAPPSQRYRSV